MSVVEDIKKCVKDISDANKADIYLISGGLNYPIDDKTLTTIESNQKNDNALLILTTFGGDADVAFRIARFFQQAYKEKFIILIDDICQSAGTLIAVGAHELIMSDNAQLGPLDVQLGKPDELAEVISGLTPIHALSFLHTQTFDMFEHNFLTLVRRSENRIKTKTASKIATKLTTGLFQPIYAQLDPIRLGEYHRNMLVAGEYGERLNNFSKNLKQSSLKTLTHGYPSHSFVIDRKEAGELFENVRAPSENEDKLARLLRPINEELLTKKDEFKRYIATIHYLEVEQEDELEDKPVAEAKQEIEEKAETKDEVELTAQAEEEKIEPEAKTEATEEKDKPEAKSKDEPEDNREDNNE